jgi:hypothetical protein
VPYSAPLVALITPNGAVSRSTIQALLDDGHDISSIAVFHGRAAHKANRLFRA